MRDALRSIRNQLPAILQTTPTVGETLTSTGFRSLRGPLKWLGAVQPAARLCGKLHAKSGAYALSQVEQGPLAARISAA